MPVPIDPTIAAGPVPQAPVHPFMAGVQAVATDENSQAYRQEQADVAAWQRKIEEARKFDENARKQYALDRRYAHGDTASRVKVPIAGVYINLLESLLYARNPDLDATPAPQCEPPPMADVIAMARKQLMQQPDVLQQAVQAGLQAAQNAADAQQALAAMGPPPPPDPNAPAPAGAGPAAAGPPQPQAPLPDPAAVGMQAGQAFLDQQAHAQAIALLAPYHQRQSDAKQFGKTLEIIVADLWRKGALKAQAELKVRSALTVGIGWFKSTWQERTGANPTIRGQINDLQDNLRRLAALQTELDDGTAPNTDEQRAAIEQQIAGLTAQCEKVIARGLAIDYVAPEDIQVAPGFLLVQYKDAPWIAHRTYKPVTEALALYPNLKDKLGTAAQYYQRKPADPSEVRDTGALTTVTAEDADAYTKSKGATAGEANCAIWEVWNRDSNQIITFVEGVNCYATPPYAPNVGTTRFYPFFAYSPVKVDGDRHPESLTKRSASLLDEYIRTRSNKSEHRARCLPKTGFNSTNYSPEEIQKLEAGGIAEMVPLKPLNPNSPIKDALAEIAYPAIDPALYETAEIRSELEMIWGIQEALSSTIRTPKTATEADIQQQGTNARDNYKRDNLDSDLGEFAHYTAEIAVQKVTPEDAIEIAGPWAFWPPGMTIENMGALVLVEIRAGSSGKPDTAAQQQTWSVTMPLLQNSIMEIGQLRGSSPADIADCLEELVAETLKRTGDRLDPDRFLPPPPQGGAMGGPGFGAPAPGGMPMGPPAPPMKGPPMPMGGGAMPPPRPLH